MSVRERGLYWVRHKNSPKSWLIGRYHPEKGWSQYDNGATMFEENMVEIGQRIVSPTEIPSLDAPPLNLSPSQVNWLIMALDYQRRSRIKESTINDEK